MQGLELHKLHTFHKTKVIAATDVNGKFNSIR